ncbi:MAG: hypothetical protein JXJ04_25495 [Spirochaetales bacterium]|nr:hypothetical protein [Spirochaetales bacterium]
MGQSIAIKTERGVRLRSEAAYLDVAITRDWESIPLAMEFFTDFTILRMNNCEDTHKIGIAVSELLENAVKYSGKEIIRIKLNKAEKGNTITLHVINKTNKKHARRLIARIKELNSIDSLTYYIQRMKESIKNKEESAGLGLARVYHETEAKLSVRYFRLKKLVEVTATITLQNEEE